MKNKEEYYFVISNDGDTVDRIRVCDINYIALWATQLPSVFEYEEFPGYFKALENYYEDNYDRYKECYQRIVATDDGKSFLDTTINLVLFQKQIQKIIQKPMKNKNTMDDEKIQQYTNLLVDWQEQLEINQTTFVSEYVDRIYYRKKQETTSAIDDFKNKAESYINWLNNLSKTNPELAKEIAKKSLIATGVLNEDGSPKEYIVDYPSYIDNDEELKFYVDRSECPEFTEEQKQKIKKK